MRPNFLTQGNMKTIQEILGEPYLSVLDSPWGELDITTPNAVVVSALDVSRFHFNRLAKSAGYFSFGKYNAKTWWEDGMQNRIANTVHIFSDDLSDGVYAGYCIQNCITYFRLLCKLVDGDEFTEACREKLTTFMRFHNI